MNDRTIELDRQWPSDEGLPVSTLEKGHVTGSLATAALREHVASAF
ncbi:hypothetical protein [Natrinema salaciae]|nr:hypothetical protein [Natrinema salaciae]